MPGKHSTTEIHFQPLKSIFYSSNSFSIFHTPLSILHIPYSLFPSPYSIFHTSLSTLLSPFYIFCSPHTSACSALHTLYFILYTPSIIFRFHFNILSLHSIFHFCKLYSILHSSYSISILDIIYSTLYTVFISHSPFFILILCSPHSLRCISLSSISTTYSIMHSVYSIFPFPFSIFHTVSPYSFLHSILHCLFPFSVFCNSCFMLHTTFSRHNLHPPYSVTHASLYTVLCIESPFSTLHSLIPCFIPQSPLSTLHYFSYCTYIILHCRILVVSSPWLILYYPYFFLHSLFPHSML